MNYFRDSKRHPLLLVLLFLGLSTASVVGDGEGPNDHVIRPSISGDGRFVAFLTKATNLLEEPTDPTHQNILWMDRTTRRIYNAQLIVGPVFSEYFGGANYHSLSRDGEWLVFNSSNNFIDGNDGVVNVFVSAVRSRADSPAAPTLFKMVSRAPNGDPGNGISKVPAISGNGRYIIFKSNATNLTADAVNGTDYHHYYLDRDLDENGIFDEDGPGKYLISLIGGTSLKAAFDDGKRPTLSTDGSRALFFADTGAKWYNGGAVSNTIGIAGGLTPEGTVTYNTVRYYPAGNASHSGTYYRYRNPMQETFPFPDRGEGAIPSSGGSFVLTSTESDMGGSDTNGHRDIYLINRQTTTVSRISSALGGGPANGNSGFTAFEDRTFDMSADARFIAFSTNATNMGFADNNGTKQDIIIIDRGTGQRDRVEKGGTALGPNPAYVKSLKNKIKRLKKALKRAKKAKKKSAIKRIKKQLKRAQKQLNLLLS